MSRKGIKNIKRIPKMPAEPKPDFAVVLTEGIFKSGGLIDKLEIVDLMELVAQKKSSCLCVKYAGENFNCPEHIAKIECPKCRCLDVEHELHATPEFAEYNCTICGFFYARNLNNGNYQYM